MSWTDERVELLRQLWLDGKSASQISAALGAGLTRNAVIGKVHRLGTGGPRQGAGAHTVGPPPRPPPCAALDAASGGAGAGAPTVRGNTALAIAPSRRSRRARRALRRKSWCRCR